MKSTPIDSGIPVLKIVGSTLPEVWERSVIACWEEGAAIRTEYDKEGDPPSRDCTMIMVVREPRKEPRIHRAFPGGLEDLETYRQEVVYGVHDHWVSRTEGGWSHTYHGRLAKYDLPLHKESECGVLLRPRTINQLDLVVEKLIEAPYTRRAQVVTWKVWCDPQDEFAPCLQRIWFRIVGDELICNVHIRSNDAYKAAFMNLFAFTDLQRVIAERVSAGLERVIRPGQLVWIADSYHIYGSYFGDFEGFLKSLTERSFDERTWTSKFAEPFFEDARERLRKEKEQEQEQEQEEKSRLAVGKEWPYLESDK